MTLLLICYMCGQSEKVRLSMWLLIISVATYIFAFGGTSVYAMESSIQANEYGLYDTTFEDVQQPTVQEQEPTPVVFNETTQTEVVTPETTVAPASSGTMLVRHKLSDTAGKLQVAPTTDGGTSILSEELGYLIALEGSFLGSNVYKGNNVVFYKLLQSLLEKKAAHTHEMYIEKTMELISQLSSEQLARYNLDGSGIISALTAIKITAENNAQGSGSTADGSLGSYYNVITISPSLVRLNVVDSPSLKRISFYVNDMFATGCEGSQCNSMLLEASSGDVVTAHITIQNHMSTVVSGRM